MSPLSLTLLTLGFRHVLGTIQFGFHGQRSEVKSGVPRRYACNNGVLAVYDDAGDPWIARYEDLKLGELNALVRDFGLKEGAHVPHSCDGGRFLRNYVHAVSA